MKGRNNMKAMTETKTEPSRMYETENDIPKVARTELIALINQRLADVIDLQLQLKQAHWKDRKSVV